MANHTIRLRRRPAWIILFSMLVLALAAGMVVSTSGAFAGAPASSPSGAGSTQQAITGGVSSQPAPPVGKETVNCATISSLGLDRQMNVHAAQIVAACQAAGKYNPATSTGPNQGTGNASSVKPLAIGGTDQDVILPDGTYPHVTQSEAMVWGHGTTIVVNYNDSRTASSCYAGVAYSVDGGLTWVHTGQPMCSGHGTNFGDPIVVWNDHLGAWYAGDLATGCGGQGIGMWTSPNGITWTTGACAHNGGSDDRESMWVDNNPSSPHYGRMYISWNNFAVGVGALQVTYSDNGTTWSAPVNVYNTSTFMRDVQITGDLGGSGTVFIAGMNEGGGGLNPRQNHMFRSTDGGLTWTDVTMGPTFPAPGRAVSGYFAGMYPGGYWRHMGWGQPAAVGNVVHYAYASGASGDPGNVMYTRSTDNGTTWSTPIQLNTDSTTRAQWQPSLAATAGNAVYVGWYDERETTSCGTQGSTTPCYRRYGRVSLDGGVTWQTDDQVGDVVSPLPGQPDSAIQTLYAGDYNYDSSDGTNVYDTWTDGRTIINNASQQDVYFDKIPLVQGTPTPTVTGTPPTATSTRTPTITPSPTSTPCGQFTIATATGTIVPGTTDIGNHCDDCDTQITLPFAFNLYNTNYSTVNASSNGRLDFVTINDPGGYSNQCLPVTGYDYTIFPFWDDGYTMNSGYGIFTSISGSAPNRIFNIEWRNQFFPGTGSANYEVRLYEGQSRFDVVYGSLSDPGSSATVGVQGPGGLFTQYECNTGGLTNGLMLIFTSSGCGGGGTPTATPTGPTQTPTNTPSPSPTQCGQAAGWVAGPDFPSPVIRSLGVYFPANGKFYTLGGRTSDSAGSDIVNPYEYNPGTNSWTMKSATFADNQVNNMAGGVLNVGGTPLIVAVGGSAAGATTATDAVRYYNPATDTFTPVTTDPWPGDATGDTLPGGFAVLNNKLYILGGFQINVAMTDTIWEYDPSAAAGSRWHQKSAHLGAQLGYVPAVGLGNYIYTAGGSDYSTGTLVDVASSYRYDPVADSITNLPDLPQYTAETRAVAVQGKVWVLGGGRTAPNPSSIVQVYDPATNAWTSGPAFVTPRRNFPADSDGSNIWLVGGYAPTSPDSTMEIYHSAVPCGPTVTATSTATSTGVASTSTPTSTHTSVPTTTSTPGSPTVTPTECVMNFSDVQPSDYFYNDVHCVYCLGAVSGYSDGTFRPFNNTTRGQLTKIIVVALRITVVTPTGTPTFNDAPANSPFYPWIETAAAHHIVSGYDCGGVGEPCPGLYYRPNAYVTRGQLSKIAVISANQVFGWDLINPPAPTFTDVPVDSPFYTYIETAYCHGVISGYSDGTFRPQNNAIRAQISKIVCNVSQNPASTCPAPPTATAAAGAPVNR